MKKKSQPPCLLMIAMFITGVILFFGSLWAVAYLIGLFPWEHWTNFPALVTGLVGCSAGIILVVGAFALNDEDDI